MCAKAHFSVYIQRLKTAKYNLAKLSNDIAKQ